MALSKAVEKLSQYQNKIVTELSDLIKIVAELMKRVKRLEKEIK